MFQQVYQNKDGLYHMCKSCKKNYTKKFTVYNKEYGKIEYKIKTNLMNILRLDIKKIRMKLE